MRRLTVFTLGAFFCAVSSGQNLLEGVDRDVLHGLLLHGHPDPVITVSRAVPQELAAIQIPRPFTLIGSSERNMGAGAGDASMITLVAAYRTGLAPDAARDQALSALTAGGWEVQPEISGMTSVFVGNGLRPSTTSCRDGKPIAVSTNAIDGTTYVLFSIRRDGRNSGCDVRMRTMMARSDELDPHLPKLEPPIDPKTGAPVRSLGGGGGGSGTSGRHFRTQFMVEDSAANVANHFARQLAAQGWARETSWSGESTAGSSWSRRADAQTMLQATLHVIAMDSDQVGVVVHIASQK